MKIYPRIFQTALIGAIVFGIFLIVDISTAPAQGQILHITSCQVLDHPDTTYILDNDVQSDNSCFLVTADNVTLDLNGHTITYALNGNSTPTYTYNGADYNCFTYNGHRLGNYGHYGVYIDADPRQMPDAYPLIGWRWNLNPKNFVLKNGTIKQGTNATHSGDAVHLTCSNAEICNLTIEISGPDCQAIYARDANIHHNTITSYSNFVENRHEGRAVIYSSKGKVHDNIIRGGPQWAIRISAASGVDGADVYNNDIRHNTVVANGYGIGAYADNMEVYGNKIDTNGEYSGRGIHIGAKNVSVHDNVLNLSERPNSEYSTYWVHGIKLEGCTEAKVFHNDVTVNAIEKSDGRALDVSVGSNSNNEVYENIFRAVATSSVDAYAFKATGVAEDSGLIIHNNTFISNRTILYWGDSGGNGIVFRSNLLRQGPNPINPTTIVFGPYQTTCVNNQLIDTQVADGASLDSVRLYGNYAIDNSYYVKWLLNLTVKDTNSNALAGVNVTIKDLKNTQIYSGLTDADGRIPEQELTQYFARGVSSFARTAYTPHTITVTKDGFETSTQEITIDASKSLTVTLVPIFVNNPPFAADLNGVKAYPNPYRGDKHSQIIFSNLTANVNIKIYTPTGELVKEINEQEGDKAYWDVKNKQGETVSSGTYIYYITNPKGQEKKGKIAIIR